MAAREDTPTFTSPELAIQHYQTLCGSLQSRLDLADADILDFTESSRELQDELEQEIARMETADLEMRHDLEKARFELDQVKSKMTSTRREHTVTMTHMQRELESLRLSEKGLRNKLRDMELDNDDLEKSDREKDSSLLDFETRYGRAIERIALLEEELVNKAVLEEEFQRLKDEIRDQNEEMSVIKTQAAATYPPAYPRPLTPPHSTRPLVANLPQSDTDATPTRNTNHDLPTSSISHHRSSPSVSSLPRPSLPVTSLSRSSSARLTPQSVSTTTPRQTRDSRSATMISDMKEMTDRVKKLTSRLGAAGAKRDVLNNSGIPRASMSPSTSVNGISTLGGEERRNRMSGLGVSTRLPRRAGMEVEREREREDDEDDEENERRRNGLRRSVSGRPRPSTIPVRPSSRLSILSSTSSSSTSHHTLAPLTTTNYSRPITPLPLRSQTPTNSLSMSTNTRRPWGAPSLAAPITSLSTTSTFDHYPSSTSASSTKSTVQSNNSLGVSVRRRPSLSTSIGPGGGGLTPRSVSNGSTTRPRSIANGTGGIIPAVPSIAPMYRTKPDDNTLRESTMNRRTSLARSSRGATTSSS